MANYMAGTKDALVKQIEMIITQLSFEKAHPYLRDPLYLHSQHELGEVKQRTVLDKYRSSKNSKKD